ncbi:MAG: AAA family ATPase [Cardiobacteriaceae bacterium]|nr:AAA family ATPase [Cardiobacteriaceae bacterium]
MRIERLTLHNINALQGKWSIDFTALAESGIFAITGPTGAGKSTILDAICLALYGQTPRLGKITASHNALMSRHTGECSAEVEIAAGGRRYRVFWGQKRARGKADGKLQAARHEIADADSGEILEEKPSRTAPKVAELTGLDFERFMRAVLLAQGQFAAFLHAGGDERAPILEQITGTAIYSQISIAVHARHSEAQQALQRLVGDSAHLAPPDDAALAQLCEALAAAAQAVADGKAAREASAARLAQLRQWAAQQTLVAQLAAEREAAEANWQALAEIRAALARYRQSEPGVALYRDGQREQAAHAALCEKIAQNQQQKESLQARVQESAARVQEAAARTQAAREAENAAEPQLRAAREYDSAHRHLQSRAREDEARLQTLAFAAADAMTALAAQPVDKAALEARYHQALGGKTADDWQQALDAARERFVALRELVKMQEAQQALAAEMRTAQETLAARQTRAQQAVDAETQAQQSLAAATEKTVDKRRIYEYAMRTQSFATHRAHLHEGEPCPLCGAREHPYASGAPLPDDDRAALRAAELAEEKAKKAWQQAHGVRVEAGRDVAHAKEAVEALAARAAQEAQSLAQGLRHWQVEGGLPEALAACESEGKALGERIRALHALQREREQAANILRARDWQSAWQALAALHQEIAANRAARKAALAAPDADAHAALLRAAVNDSLAAQQAMEAAHQAERERLGKLDAEKETLLALQAAHAQAAARAEGAFAAFLREAGFADHADWQAAQQVAAEVDGWQTSVQQASAQREQAQARLLENERTLAEWRAALPAELPDEEALAAEHEANEARYADALQQQGQYLAEEREYARRAALWQARRGEIAAQQRECDDWRQMYDLIGSADGKKFRNFAQGLTFDVMIHHANQELAKMSDRYLLVRAAGAHLELDVIDDWQGGEVRTTKNLSGGEQFIVSLALALGLAKMAGENIRIDSLFLDEGFGTLDEQSLDQALDTLAALPQEGKLIGIISHVGSLRERIPTQIRVTPQAGGVSTLSGNGVKKL